MKSQKLKNLYLTDCLSIVQSSVPVKITASDFTSFFSSGGLSLYKITVKGKKIVVSETIRDGLISGSFSYEMLEAAIRKAEGAK